MNFLLDTNHKNESFYSVIVQLVFDLNKVLFPEMEPGV